MMGIIYVFIIILANLSVLLAPDYIIIIMQKMCKVVGNGEASSDRASLLLPTSNPWTKY